MPADLPALTRLTDDVVAAMHAAEDAQRRRSRWRREFPLAVVILALLVPATLALRAMVGAATPDDHQPAPQPKDHHIVRAAAQACGVGAGTLATGLGVRAIFRPSAGRFVGMSPAATCA
jgi:hypothetical protein